MSVSQETKTKERPILFSGPMVRAIIEGKKTQTRRVINPQPPADHTFLQPESGTGRFWWNDGDEDRDDLGFWPSYDTALACPYGRAGDRLWVREAFCLWNEPAEAPWKGSIESARGADGVQVHYMVADREWCHGGWKPSIHMPRWASRIDLEIVAEPIPSRLQEITVEDSIAEGSQVAVASFVPRLNGCLSERTAFAQIWDQINGPRGFAWQTNPWVWSVSFKRASVDDTEGLSKGGDS